MNKFNYIFLILLSFLFSGNNLFAQEINITGTVIDHAGLTLPGVTVSIKGTAIGTITDIDGNYELKAAKGSVLLYSYVGYEAQEIKVESQSQINVTLSESLIGLDEIIVIGYGTQSRRKVTSAISKVDGSVVANLPVASLGDGLKGKLTGARIYTNNNAPGADPVIHIRGGSSINRSNNPLVLVDGVERSLKDINNNDIASIEVLKDAASTAIYGSRASNGIIMITTKKGAYNQAPTITFSANLGRQMTERNYKFLEAKDYISYMRPLLSKTTLAYFLDSPGNSVSAYNDDTSIYTTRYLGDSESVPDGWESMPDPLDPSKTLVFQNNNFMNEAFKPALWQNYYLGINGGSDAIRYSGSVGYTGDGGVAAGTGWTRISARANIETKLSDKLKLISSFDVSESKSSQFESQYEVIARGMLSPPTQRLYWDDGTPTRGYNVSSPGPLYYDWLVDNEHQENRSGVNASILYQIIPNLSLTINGSYYYRTYQWDYFRKADQFNGARPAQSQFSNNKNLKGEAFFNYNKTVRDVHNISGVAGISYADFYYKNFHARVSGASSDKIPTLNAGSSIDAATTTKTYEVLAGAFGRLSYDYKAKYLVSLTFRADGSSRFSKENRWGYFPGVSAGWMVSEESFWNSSAVSSFKIRASLGQTGNNDVDLTSAFGTYNVTYKYEGASGIRSTAMENKSLAWETSTQFDIGFDLGLFDDKLTITADYFNKKTDDLIFSKQLPNTSGYSSVLANVGSVRFYGGEIELSSINIQKKNFEWISKFTYSYVKNKVLKLIDNGRDKNRIGGYTLADGTSFGGIAEGEPLYRFYGYKVSHILQTDGEAANAMYDDLSGGYDHETGTSVKGRKAAGDYEWVDLDGDGKITSYDQFELGVTVPHSTGGIGNAFKYKNWLLNIYFDYALGHSIYDQIFQYSFMATFEGNSALSEHVKQTWTSPNDGSKYARLVAGSAANTPRNFYRTSDIFTFKGDYLCLREISLQYSLPQNVLDRMGGYIKGLDISFSANNVHYFTNLIGISPEVGSSTTYNASYNSYPPIRKFVFGVNFIF